MPDIFIAEPKNEPKPPAPIKETTVLQEKAKSKRELFNNENDHEPDNSVHLFSAFKKNPQGITFEDQEDDEKIVLFIRKSFVTNLKWIFIGSFLAILPLFLTLFLGVLQNPLPTLSTKYYLLLGLFYYLFVASYWYINFITWYFNIDLVTNKRIVDVNFSNLVYKDVAATELSFIHDVSFSQVGAIRTFFDYGNIIIQVPGASDAFIFESAPQPENIVHIVEALVRKTNEPNN
jgi:hypothetical protein